MIIAVGNDHAGYPLKRHVLHILEHNEVKVIDYGCHSTDPVDFPDISRLVCQSVIDQKADRGLMVCGTGVGAAIAANKMPGIRAAVCHDTYSAHQCVEHDDVNVMCIGAQIVGSKLVKELLESFLKAEFSTEEPFRRRVRKLGELEIQSAQTIINNR